MVHSREFYEQPFLDVSREFEEEGGSPLCHSDEVSPKRRNHEQAHCFLVGMVHMSTLPGHCHRYLAFADQG